MFCVVLRNLTLVLFKVHSYRAIRSTTLSLLLIYILLIGLRSISTHSMYKTCSHGQSLCSFHRTKLHFPCANATMFQHDFISCELQSKQHHSTFVNRSSGQTLVGCFCHRNISALLPQPAGSFFG